MQLDLTNAPPVVLCRTFDIITHSQHVDLIHTACFAITSSKEHINKLPFKLVYCADTYEGTSYYDEDGFVNQDSLEPDTIQPDLLIKLQWNILLFYKFAVEASYTKDLSQVVIAYDGEFADIAASFLAGYHVLRDESPEEAIALVALSHPYANFDYPTVCFLDLSLDCNQKLIEAAETYEVMEVAVTKSGQVIERVA